jgi:hypothetical protein
MSGLAVIVCSLVRVWVLCQLEGSEWWWLTHQATLCRSGDIRRAVCNLRAVMDHLSSMHCTGKFMLLLFAMLLLTQGAMAVGEDSATFIAVNANGMHQGGKGHMPNLFQDRHEHRWAVAGITEVRAVIGEWLGLVREIRGKKKLMDAWGTPARPGAGNLHKGGALLVVDTKQASIIKGSQSVVIKGRAVKANIRLTGEDKKITCMVAYMPTKGTNASDTKAAWSRLTRAMSKDTVLLMDANADDARAGTPEGWTGDACFKRFLESTCAVKKSTDLHTHGCSSCIDHIVVGERHVSWMGQATMRAGWSDHKIVSSSSMPTPKMNVNNRGMKPPSTCWGQWTGRAMGTWWMTG